MESTNPLRRAPRKSVIIFLLAVFFTFGVMALANDIMAVGRQPVIKLGISLVLSGVFAVSYAAGGISLRKKFFFLFVPLFGFQVLLMGYIAHAFPDAKATPQLDAAQTSRLQKRLIFDGIAMIVTVSLGYAGFVHVFVRETRRHIQAQAEKAQLEAEMAAAREVQRLMLPEEAETFPGYLVDFVYRPALQLGGDFFQILPDGSDGFLLVLGDVAGKGLAAAMHVSMLVGVIRSVALETRDPAIVLKKLHDRLVGRTSGISTALAAHVSASGVVTIANAGHLSPYLDGREIELPGALPLGIAEGGDYSAVRFELTPGGRLTFYSDGVVEAQSKTGELFGFDRARAISGEVADAIVEKAVQFGQADDITVVTIKRLANVEGPMMSVTNAVRPASA
ncbi:PP2C family protein-serine/threonine phosphatase [Occallatibacter savannae]|uniref:PP2C family protein-serine/threonine phosphatase n=1 Tax=Occallatibacter savannae TaxID=1002691 RepID=UPI000D68AE92|nr:PP2C family protein-serine/threonine phosphatase [Occallatibacter savannae]